MARFRRVSTSFRSRCDDSTKHRDDRNDFGDAWPDRTLSSPASGIQYHSNRADVPRDGLGRCWGCYGSGGTLLLVSPWALYLRTSRLPGFNPRFSRNCLQASHGQLRDGRIGVALSQLRTNRQSCRFTCSRLRSCAGTYVVSLALLPGGRKELGGLAAELLTALRRRSSKESEPTGGAAG